MAGWRIRDAGLRRTASFESVNGGLGLANVKSGDRFLVYSGFRSLKLVNGRMGLANANLPDRRQEVLLGASTVESRRASGRSGSPPAHEGSAARGSRGQVSPRSRKHQLAKGRMRNPLYRSSVRKEHGPRLKLSGSGEGVAPLQVPRGADRRRVVWIDRGRIPADTGRSNTRSQRGSGTSTQV